MKQYTFNNATITGFKVSEGTLKIYFIEDGSETKKSTLAHPATFVKELMENKQNLTIVATEQGWKLCKPFPTAEQIAEYEARKTKSVKVEAATEDQLKLIATF
jgi:hypothetical protein